MTNYKILKGLPASPGNFYGVACHVRIEQIESFKSDVPYALVAKNTSQDYSSLLYQAGALITEVGGKLSHLVLIARELGIPAVVGVNDTTHLDGKMVHVNGDTGEIQYKYNNTKYRHKVMNRRCD